MNDPKLERCKQIIQQYEENQKKIKIELSKKPKVKPVRERPPKISIPKKENRIDPMKDVVSDIKKIDYNSVQDIKDKVKEDIRLDQDVNLDLIDSEDEEEDKPKDKPKPKPPKPKPPKPIRSSISENIKEKINQETPKKDKYQEAIDKDTSLLNFLDKLKDMEDEESEEEESLFVDKEKEVARQRIDEQNKKGLTQAQKKKLREKETKEREDKIWADMVKRREERRQKSGFYKPVKYLDDDDDEDY
jgi:dsDNA-binding SOS-regulon protein